MIREFGFSDIAILIEATRWTLLLSLVAIAGGGLLGFGIALLRVSRFAPLRWLTGAYIQVLQGTPVLMLLFLTFYGLGIFGYRLPPFVAASLALILYSSAFLGEIWRGCIQAVPKPQWEGAAGLALSRTQQMMHVILPQAARIAVPPTVGFLVQVIKNTSITSIIGLVELARAGQLVSNATFRPLTVYACVALIYIALCLPLSKLSKRLERRLNFGRVDAQMGI